jgi:uncharacterized membrane protein YgdD (TMEM256/DUF423 family)
MSPVDFVCISSLAFISVGIGLTYQSPKRTVRAIGHCLYVGGFVGLAFSGWKILAITFPIPTVRLGQLQFVEWVIGGGVIGLTYSYIIGRTLAEQLQDQADAVKDFSSRLTQGNPALLSLNKPLWRRIARNYYRECGKRALRLLRRSADPNFRSNYKAIARPEQFRDFFTIEMYLRAAALGVRYHRVRRTIRYASFAMAIALATFCGTWIAVRGV